MTEKKQNEQYLSERIHKNFVQLVMYYSDNSIIKIEQLTQLIQEINLLNVSNLSFIKNNELDEVIEILELEFINKNTLEAVSLLCVLEYLKNPSNEFKKNIFINLSLKVPKSSFLEAFSILASISPSVKDLFENFILYVFNKKFLTLNDNIQIDCIYKIWGTSLELFNDNEAFKFAYKELKKLFEYALKYEKTELAFWLYYVPLHYFNSGTGANIDELNEKFKGEIERPLEQYIQKKIVPKYNILANKKELNRNSKIKVAFVMQRIIKHSTVNVFYSLVKSLMNCNNDKYEFILYDLAFPEFNGSNVDFVEKFKELGIEYRNLHQEIFQNSLPTYSLLEKSIKTREILISDNIDILIGLHTRVEYIFLYATRTAPIQIYWYHSSNAQYNIKGIDKRITHGGIPNNADYKFNEFILSRDYSEYKSNKFKETVLEIRKKLPTNSVILGSIGRLVKVDSKEYLDMVFKILENNDNCIYLACGEGDKNNIQKAVKDRKLEHRFIFTGMIDPSIYNKVIDIYLNTFPSSSGESLNEYIAAGGVPVILLPKEHPAIEEIFQNEWDKKYERIHSFSKEDYFLLANELIKNKKIREKLSQENINRFLDESLSMKNSSNSFINILNKLITE